MDDMLIAAKSKIDIDALKAMLSSEFEMKDLGEFEMKDLGVSKKILGMEIWRDRNASLLCVSQKKYIENLLQSFQMENSKPDSTPLAIHLMLDVSTLPDRGLSQHTRKT